MNNIKRRDAGLPYISDDNVMEQQKRARKLTQELNTVDRSDFDKISAIVKELLGKSEGAFINPPFYCDYGNHIEVGKNFFANYNCTILDVAKVKIGDNCQLAPNVAIYTAGHPVHPDTRNTMYEYGIEVVLGDNVWIGGNTVSWRTHRKQYRDRSRQRSHQRYPRLVHCRRKPLQGNPHDNRS